MVLYENVESSSTQQKNPVSCDLTWVVIRHTYTPAVEFQDPQNGVIMIDVGHGGIDGGTNRDGLLEKDINLLIAQKLKDILELKG